MAYQKAYERDAARSVVWRAPTSKMTKEFKYSNKLSPLLRDNPRLKFGLVISMLEKLEQDGVLERFLNLNLSPLRNAELAELLQLGYRMDPNPTDTVVCSLHGIRSRPGGTLIFGEVLTGPAATRRVEFHLRKSPVAVYPILLRKLKVRVGRYDPEPPPEEVFPVTVTTSVRGGRLGSRLVFGDMFKMEKINARR